MTDTKTLLNQLSPEKRALLAQRLGQARLNQNGAAKTTEPALTPNPAARFEPFPLTDLQQAYWVGRSGVFEVGTVASHSYLELEAAGLDVLRLAAAWQKLVDRHDMLRAIILPDGRQQVLADAPPYDLQILDLRGHSAAAAEEKLQQIRHRMSHQVRPSDQWPLFEICAARLPQERTRLHVSLDGLIVDAWSINLLLRQWAHLYQNPQAVLPPLELSFRDYALAEIDRQNSDDYRRAKAYWQDRLANLPPAPDLPLAQNPATLETVRFARCRGTLPAPQWAQLKERAVQAGLTPPGVLLAAYAEVLAVWAKSPRFTLSVPRFNRLPLHPQVNELVGEFASFTFLAVDASGNESFLTRARRHQAQLWQDLNHAAYSGVQVLRELAQAAGRPALMPVVFTSLAQDNRAESPGPSLRGDVAKVVFAINQTSQVWLDNHVSEENGALVCDWDFVEGLFPTHMPQDMFDAFMRLLHLLADDDAAWQEPRAYLAHRLVPPAQLAQRAALAREIPVPDSLAHQPFFEQAARQPDQPAIVAPGRTLTYGQTAQLANRWAWALRQAGAAPNQLVAVVMEKGWEQFVAALAVLQAGAAYVPIDAAVPTERLHELLAQSGAQLVLTQSWLDKRLEWPANSRRFWVDAPPPAEFPAEAPPPVQTPTDLAVVIFTSGSTGQPKGVMVAHRGLVNCLVDTQHTFNITPADTALALTALHHDMSLFDLLGVLGAGGQVVVPAAWGRRDPAHWAELMRQHRVTVWNSVPAMMEMLLEFAAGRPGLLPDSLRLAFLGGDWIPVTLPDRLRGLVPAAQVVSVGGPTETTLWNIWYPVETVDPAWPSIPYGRPIANTRYYVLNEVLEDCPTWVPGELCCAGPGLAQGYWNDPDKTAAKFVTHPRTGQRLCRTGDLGRYLSNGTLEFLGRADFQVKINGQRIELGEVEAALQRHPQVRAAVVTAYGDGQSQRNSHLAAYVVPQNGAVLSPPDLRGFLLDKLPDFMVPAAFVSLPELPLTANGKVNRQALPPPGQTTAADTAPAQSAGLAARIAAIVAEVLGQAQVDPQADLVSLGANSIDMVRIGNRLEQQLGFRPRMDQLFRLRTPAALAGYLEPFLADETPARPDDSSAVGQIISSFKSLLTPQERDAFKASQPGLRRKDADKPAIPLARPPADEALKKLYTERRSWRTFSQAAIPLDDFGRFLSCLAPLELDGKPKYRYASPGGLYPTQAYLHLKPGRVAGLEGGAYYYHPVEHRLVTLAAGADIDRSIHIPFINTPIFDEAAFSIFFITQLSAIAPSYGHQSIHFATLEAGIMAHLLETSAPACGVGLCQIGSVEFEPIRPLFDLDNTHVLIHSLVGGRLKNLEDYRRLLPQF